MHFCFINRTDITFSEQKLIENVSLFVSENMIHVSEIISWTQIVNNLHKFMEFT